MSGISRSKRLDIKPKKLYLAVHDDPWPFRLYSSHSGRRVIVSMREEEFVKTVKWLARLAEKIPQETE